MFLYGREIFLYFIHANILESYNSMCNYNIESKKVQEKKRLVPNQFYYYPPTYKKKSDHASASLGLTECMLLYNMPIS